MNKLAGKRIVWDWCKANMPSVKELDKKASEVINENRRLDLADIHGYYTSVPHVLIERDSDDDHELLLDFLKLVGIPAENPNDYESVYDTFIQVAEWMEEYLHFYTKLDEARYIVMKHDEKNALCICCREECFV